MVDDNIRDKEINREAIKISAWSSDKVVKHEYFTLSFPNKMNKLKKIIFIKPIGWKKLTKKLG